MFSLAVKGRPLKWGGAGMADSRFSTSRFRSARAASNGMLSSMALMPPTGSPECAERPVTRTSTSTLPKQPPHIRGSAPPLKLRRRSEEHTSELQSLMRISYAVFCLTKKTQHNNKQPHHHSHN